MAEVPRFDLNDINEDMNQEIGGTPGSAGTGTPSIGNIYRRRVARQQALQRWGEMSPSQQVSAVGQAGIRAIPMAGKPLHEYAFGGDQSDIEAAREGAPWSTFGAQALGGGLPYMVPGGPISLAGRTAAGGLIGGADALTEGQDPIRGAITGSLGSATGHFLPSAITPRPILKDLRQKATHIFDSEYRVSPDYRRDLGDYINRNMPPNQWGNRQIYDVLTERYRTELIDKMFHVLAREHGFIGRPNIDLSGYSPLSRGLSGAGLGYLMGIHPGVSAIAGLLAGPVTRRAQRVIDRTVDNPNVIRYFNNELMGTTGARNIHGPATGAATQSYENRIPEDFTPYETLRAQIMGPRRNAP